MNVPIPPSPTQFPQDTDFLPTSKLIGLVFEKGIMALQQDLAARVRVDGTWFCGRSRTAGNRERLLLPVRFCFCGVYNISSINSWIRARRAIEHYGTQHLPFFGPEESLLGARHL